MTASTLECGGWIDPDLLEELDVEAIVSLIRCRHDELEAAGCDSPGCFVLAGRLDVELGRAADLVGRGCTPELALRILL